MKLFYRGKDGGDESSVWGYWLIEWKSLFSIALLRFEGASREAYHTHAFNSISWLLRGFLTEHHLSGKRTFYHPSLRPIRTSRSTFHKVHSEGRSWVLTFRGPWNPTWSEYREQGGQFVTLGHGRVEQ